MADAASTAVRPWSGYWWPYKEQANSNLYDPMGPLARYDTYVINTRGYDPQSTEYEAANFRTTDPKATWWGHCQGLVAASILTREPPTKGIVKNGVTFRQDDLEGLVTDLYSNPTYQWLSGNRAYSDDPKSAAFQDINPAWMDYLLRYYVGQHQHPFAMDVFAGAAVWNYPVFAYSRDATAKADGSQHVKTTVWFSDAAYGAAHTKYFAKTYEYDLHSTGDGHTDGAWTGASRSDHPDFAWVPTGRGPALNPKLDPAIVSEILGYQV